MMENEEEPTLEELLSKFKDAEEELNDTADYMQSSMQAITRNQDAVHVEFKMKHENAVSTVDYLLGFFRQIFAILCAALASVFVIPKDVLDDADRIRDYLTVGIVAILGAIIYLLIARYRISSSADSIISDRINLQDMIMNSITEFEKKRIEIRTSLRNVKKNMNDLAARKKNSHNEEK